MWGVFMLRKIGIAVSFVLVTLSLILVPVHATDVDFLVPCPVKGCIVDLISHKEISRHISFDHCGFHCNVAERTCQFCGETNIFFIDKVLKKHYDKCAKYEGDKSDKHKDLVRCPLGYTLYPKVELIQTILKKDLAYVIEGQLIEEDTKCEEDA
ncbi:MAG: hypothetical protein RLZ12_922 [Bacillota bacterium]|jgi:hypothetical protein